MRLNLQTSFTLKATDQTLTAKNTCFQTSKRQALANYTVSDRDFFKITAMPEVIPIKKIVNHIFFERIILSLYQRR